MDKTISFFVFCLESYKFHRSITGKECFQLVQQYDVFPHLREFYDVLHTTGYQYINHDIDCFLATRSAL